MALPSTGITTSLVGNALGTSSRNVGALCSNTHGLINMWSKYKPIKNSKVVGLTEDDYKNAAYGLKYTPSTDYGIFTYDSILSSTTFPKRLGDFRNYNHNQTTGLCLKNYNLTVNIFNTISSLTIYLEDDTNKITCFDLKDTILQGYNLRCVLTSKTGNGRYYVTTIPINNKSLSFSVPYIALTTDLGSGEYSIVLSMEKNGLFYGFFPRGYERGSLSIVSNHGITAEKWGTEFCLVIDSSTENKMQDYQTGRGSKIYNLNNQNFLLTSFPISNRSTYTIGNNNIFMQFTWIEGSKRYITYVPLKKDNLLTNWTLAPSNGDNGIFGCDTSQIPKLTNASESQRNVDVNIVYKHSNGYYYNVTDYVSLRLKKDNGASPDISVNA